MSYRPLRSDKLSAIERENYTSGPNAYFFTPVVSSIILRHFYFPQEIRFFFVLKLWLNVCIVVVKDDRTFMEHSYGNTVFRCFLCTLLSNSLGVSDYIASAVG
jgi:hypothetical protein